MVSRREKIALTFGGVFLFVLFFYNFAISPIRERIEILEERIQGREKDLREITKLKSDYLAFKRDLELVEEGLAARGKDFSLFSFLEGLTVEVGIKDKLFSMSPRERRLSDYYGESIVEVRLKDIEMSELIDYLYRIENPPRFLVIDNLLVRPQRMSPGRVEVSLEVSTLTPIK